MNQTASSASNVGEHDVIQCVTFRLENETYGINVMQVQEVLRVTEIAPVPGAPDYVLGIINLRGNVVTVIDTRRRLGLPSREPDEATRIVIIETGKHVVGIMVDARRSTPPPVSATRTVRATSRVSPMSMTICSYSSISTSC